jgi:hypothetical protein
MADEEGFGMGHMVAVGGLMATLGAGGGHLGGELGGDVVVTGTIGACEYFTQHGREHERHACDARIFKTCGGLNDTSHVNKTSP